MSGTFSVDGWTVTFDTVMNGFYFHTSLEVHLCCIKWTSPGIKDQCIIHHIALQWSVTVGSYMPFKESSCIEISTT